MEKVLCREEQSFRQWEHKKRQSMDYAMRKLMGDKVIPDTKEKSASGKNSFLGRRAKKLLIIFAIEIVIVILVFIFVQVFK